MPNVSRIFKKKAIPSDPRIQNMPTLLGEMTRLPNEKLSDILFDVGSKRLRKVADRIEEKEVYVERQKAKQKAKLKKPLEKRAKIHNTIEETIAKIRKLPAETLTSEGIRQAKVLHALLAEMEKNDEEFRRLNSNSNMTYSYKSSDLPLNNLNATLNFISRIRQNKIFRKTKDK